MIRLIEALNYRCLRYVRQPLDRFHVLVGPNASGKTTFLDVVSFLGRLISGGLDEAVTDRTSNFHDLIWQRAGDGFELAIEAAIPARLRKKLSQPDYDVIRYEISLGIDPQTNEINIRAEKALLKHCEDDVVPEKMLFPGPVEVPKSIVTSTGARGTKTIVNKVPGGNDNFHAEVAGKKAWEFSYKLGPRKSALANLPSDESRFPVCAWLKDLLGEGLEHLVLNSMLMRKASPPGQGYRFRPDGSNIPWVVAELKEKHPDRFRDWIAHVNTALPDIEDIRIVDREDDRHRYLMICYRGGLEVPSWVASDGTLRLLALTLPAYLPEARGIYLIEEPENGIHPKAVETAFQSLSSVYDAQVLLATHSPVVLSISGVEDVLCFAKTPEGATDIVRGSDHPDLKNWRGETNLGVLFAAGVLG